MTRKKLEHPRLSVMTSWSVADMVCHALWHTDAWFSHEVPTILHLPWLAMLKYYKTNALVFVPVLFSSIVGNLCPRLLKYSLNWTLVLLLIQEKYALHLTNSFRPHMAYCLGHLDLMSLQENIHVCFHFFTEPTSKENDQTNFFFPKKK